MDDHVDTAIVVEGSGGMFEQDKTVMLAKQSGQPSGYHNRSESEKLALLPISFERGDLDLRGSS